MRTKKKTMVSIVMGSQSDWKTLSHTEKVLSDLQIPFEKKIVSAHRTPERLYEFARKVEKRGVEIVVAGAGGAAHLPGMIAALCSLPIIAVPIESKSLKGLDSLLSIVQMPAGIPVPTMAIGVSGAFNAGLAVASILSLKYPSIKVKLHSFRKKQTNSVKKKLWYQ